MLGVAAVVMLQVLLLHDEESWVRGSAAAALTHLAMGGCAGMQSRIGQAPGAITALVQVRTCAVTLSVRSCTLPVPGVQSSSSSSSSSS
jgi:hypothetical protein